MGGKDRHNYGEEEEDEVKWMRRMRSDQFFRKCKKRSGEEEVRRMRRIRRMRMRINRFSLRFNPSDLILGHYTQEEERERETERQRDREKERKRERE